MRIGCVSLVRVDDRFVAIYCTKGRGYILPGGKLEADETFKDCAARELKEETGLIATKQRLMFQAPSLYDEFYVMAFATEIKIFDPIDSVEGDVCLVTWKELKTSKFKAYYELLEDEWNRTQY